jgi:hypothetical protein
LLTGTETYNIIPQIPTLSPFIAGSSCIPIGDYVFGTSLPCNSTYTEYRTIILKGKNKGDTEFDTKRAGQDYYTEYTINSSSNILRWNQTYNWSSESNWNRAIGEPFTFIDKNPNYTTTTVTQLNQNANIENATLLNDSSLLGLQALKSASGYDTLTNRPQLNTSFKKINDVFGNSSSESYFVKSLDGISGAASRTG